MSHDLNDPKNRSLTSWKDLLSAEAFQVCRLGGTERPFTGEFLDHKGPGVYHCLCCGAPLFRSSEKFDSGSGWPSFYEVASPQAIEIREDRKLARVRKEVRCQGCDAHLGHVFDDGPPPTGKRFCINSVALTFRES